MSRITPFPYRGGKFRMLDPILPLVNVQDVHYIEAFGGAASVLLNKVPSQRETYNDINFDLYNFFNVLREKSGELIEALKATPYSRQEFTVTYEPREGIPDIERARQWMVRVAQSRTGDPYRRNPAWNSELTEGGKGRPAHTWRNRVNRLEAISDRLQNVALSCLPATKVIEIYDGAKTLFYLDPPYHPEARSCGEQNYFHDMTSENHEELARLLHEVQGRVVISGYHSPSYAALYADWHCIRLPPRMVASRLGERKRVQPAGEEQRESECLWTNFEVPAQPLLF